MRTIILMGASGSIGTQTVDVIREHSVDLKLVGVSVGYNVSYLIKLLDEFSDIKYAYTIEKNLDLMSKYPKIKFYYGETGLEEMARIDDYTTLVNGLVGFVGFKPTIEAIKKKKYVALANKETFVGGGRIINELLKQYGAILRPIDSEHVALWQCMRGHRKEDIRRLIITGSGGSFRNLRRDELKNVTLQDALKHPVWSMGNKITIDSATMMNKGFEVIEAHYMFGIPYEKIDVVLHAQSIVHSMVEYNDGSIIAQLGMPDMHLMIKYALLAPYHDYDKTSKYLDFDTLTTLNFKKMDYERYPLVKLAKNVGNYEGNFGAVLIGANDEAVDLFLKEKIKFIDIETFIFNTLKDAKFIKEPTVEEIVASHKWAKEYVDKLWANSYL